MAGTPETTEEANDQQGSAGKSAGRPTDFTDELGAEICGLIAEGQSLRKVCKRKKMPAISTVMRWLSDENKEHFREQYAHAREAAADALADDIQDISDGVLTKRYDANAARVAMDGKKWIASKLKPKKYGEKIDVTSGNEKLNRGMSDAELNAILARAGSAADQAGASPKA